MRKEKRLTKVAQLRGRYGCEQHAWRPRVRR
ncbi:hypothetical protein LINGRAHAP2_LOCUS7682, partial [Linum grandiflorum]